MQIEAFGVCLNDFEGLFFKEKQIRILALLMDAQKEWHLSDLARDAGVTYVHTSRFVKRCESAGVLGSEMHGKTKKIFLTEKGTKLAAKINEMGEILKSQQQAQQTQDVQAAA